MNRQDARLGILIQARMSSRRVPGKVLTPVAGRPVIQHVWERCRHVSGSDLVAIITSTEESDDPLSSWAEENDAEVYRGPLDDVAARFIQAARCYDLDAFVRVNADSPLLVPKLVDQGIEIYRAGDTDLVSNVVRRTFPVGMSVEVLDRSRYEKAYDEMESDDEREHVTLRYYRHPEDFKIESFEASRNYGDKTLAIDTPEDLERIGKLITEKELRSVDDDWEAICDLADSLGLLADRTGKTR